MEKLSVRWQYGASPVTEAVLVLLVMLAAAIAVGVFAQKAKGRTGIVWALIALACQGAVFVVFGMASAAHNPGLLETDSGMGALGIFTVGIGAGVAAVIVATLPNRAASKW